MFKFIKFFTLVFEDDKYLGRINNSARLLYQASL